jgi:3-oxoacyl-[acyl-carrier-protein] synthase II
MRTNERRVVITGLGLVTPLGHSPDAYWEGLESGRGGVGPLTAFPIEGLPCHAAGEIREFNPRALALPAHKKALAKNLKYMARDIQLAVAAAELAFADAGLDKPGQVEPTRIGIDLGAGLISTDLDELAPAFSHSTRPDGSFDYQTYGREGLEQIDPLWLLKYLPNMLACHISILNDCQGPSNTITEAEAASILAIGEAFRIVARGRADIMVTGGADSKIHPLGLIRMKLLDVMTRWDGPPEKACRPFDRSRDGWAAGEGAGILIIEELEHARRRGATIYGELLGFGSGSDAYPQGGLDPDGAGTEIAVRAALADAGLRPSGVGHVNAHGACTVVSDRAEARAYRRVFDPTDGAVPVTALKGYMGNLASGAGSVEMIGSLLGVNRGLIPATLNCDDPDPECGLDMVVGPARPTSNPTFLKTSLTRHGQAAALVVRGNPAGDPI